MSAFLFSKLKFQIFWGELSENYIWIYTNCTCWCMQMMLSVKLKNIRTPEKITVIILKFDWYGFLYPRIYAEGFIVFVFPFIRSYVHSFIRSSICSFVHSFVCSFVLPSHSWNYFKVLCASNLSGVYLTNHSSESIHILTIGTLEGRLSFHDSSPQGPCPGVGLGVKI